MPAAVLSLATVASWSRFIRSGMIDVLNQDYIGRCSTRDWAFALDGKMIDAPIIARVRRIARQ